MAGPGPGLYRANKMHQNMKFSPRPLSFWKCVRQVGLRCFSDAPPRRPAIRRTGAGLRDSTKGHPVYEAQTLQRLVSIVYSLNRFNMPLLLFGSGYSRIWLRAPPAGHDRDRWPGVDARLGVNANVEGLRYKRISQVEADLDLRRSSARM